MTELVHETNGLLAPGTHPASLEEIESALVSAECGNLDLRRAVFAGLSAWVFHARTLLGPGTAWVGGGFVSRSEPDDRALAAFQPSDRDLARQVAGSSVVVDLHNLSEVVYGSPSPGGTLRQRWPVSGLVDAHLVDEITRRAYLRGFAAVVGLDGFPVVGVTKGFVEVEVP